MIDIVDTAEGLWSNAVSVVQAQQCQPIYLCTLSVQGLSLFHLSSV